MEHNWTYKHLELKHVTTIFLSSHCASQMFPVSLFGYRVLYYPLFTNICMGNLTATQYIHSDVCYMIKAQRYLLEDSCGQALLTIFCTC